MWSVLTKANNVIQTLCILYELYKVAQKCIGKSAPTLKTTGRLARQHA